MGELFSSFEDAWRHFLARTEPLESFWEELPDDPAATIDVWLFEPPEAVRDAALELQRRFAAFDWIVPLPRHFLHVTLRPGVDWSAVAPFAAEYGPPAGFHDAVVAEVQAPALHATVPDPLFLPHLSLGYVLEEHDPEPLRRALVGLRETRLGRGVVQEALRVRVPVGKTRVLEPWTVLEAVALGGGR